MHKRLNQILAALLLGALFIGVAGLNASPVFAEVGTIFLPLAVTQNGDNVAGSTFPQEPPATVIVKKTSSESNNTKFDFVVKRKLNDNYFPFKIFDLAIGDETPSFPLVPGTYRIYEASEDGWSLTEKGCSLIPDVAVATGGGGGSGGDHSSGDNYVEMKFESGKTYQCVFNNEADPSDPNQGEIVVKKHTDVPSDQLFPFDILNKDGNKIDSFELADGDVQTFTVAAGFYKVKEGVLAGWTLADWSCSTDDPSSGKDDSNSHEDVNSATNGGGDVCTSTNGQDCSTNDKPNVPAGGTLTCEFTNHSNTREIVVKKFTDVASTEKFPFDILNKHGDSVESFELAGGEVQTFTLPAGSYKVTETVPAGWILADWSCSIDDGSDSEDNGDSGNSGASVSVAHNGGGGVCTSTNGSDCSTDDPPEDSAGGRMICEFTNHRDLRKIVVKKFTDVASPQKFPFSILDKDGNAVKSFELAGGDVQTFTLPSGSYAVTESVPAGWVLANWSCSTGEESESEDDGDSVDSVSAAHKGGGDVCTSTNGSDCSTDEPDKDHGSGPMICEFTNHIDTGEIVVKKFTDVVSDQEFPFEILGKDGQSITDTFYLRGGDVQTFTVKPGTYVVTETVPLGWTLADWSCSTVNPPTNEVEASHHSGGDNEDVCTSSNGSDCSSPDDSGDGVCASSNGSDCSSPDDSGDGVCTSSDGSDCSSPDDSGDGVCASSTDGDCQPPESPNVPGGGQLVCEFTNVSFEAPEVTKTASASYTTTHTWEITKTVTPPVQSAFAGETVGFTWTITTAESSEEGGFEVTGQITVTNNKLSDSVSGTLSDALDDSGSTAADITGCTGDGVTFNPDTDELTIAGDKTAVCDYIAYPPDRSATTNTATFTSNGIGYSGDASMSWVETVIDGEVSVDDDRNDVDFPTGPLTSGDSWTYEDSDACPTDATLYDVNGTYTYTVTNTAVVMAGDKTLDESTAEAALDCYVPTVSKDADGRYDVQHEWGIEKTVDPASQSAFAGDTADFTWTVTLTDAEAIANVAVTGLITVTNPNPDADLVVTLADVLDDGTAAVLGTCDGGTLNGNELTVSAGGAAECTYSASPADHSAIRNTATVTLNEIAFAANADVVWTPNELGSSVVVSDVQNDVDFPTGPLTGGDSWTYKDSYPCPSDAGSYVVGGTYLYTETNVAVVSVGNEALDQATAQANVNCYAPVVAKDATASWTQGAEWTLDKRVTPSSAKKFAGESATFDYTVMVTKTVADKFTVSGLISVTNPAGSPGAMDVSLADLLAGGTSAVIDCGAGATSVSVDPGQTKSCAYTGELADNIDGTNTATATFNAIDFTATAGYVFGEGPVPSGEPETVTVQDVYNGAPAQVLGTTSDSHTYTYSHDATCSRNPSEYNAGFDSTTYANTASIQETTGDSDSAQVTLDCYAPIVSKDADPEWQREYGWNIVKSVSPASHAGVQGDTFTSLYTVTVSRIVTDSGFMVFGTISVTNPAGAPGPMTVDVADQVGASTATVDCGAGATSVTVPAGSTVPCSYLMPLSDASNLVNTATVKFNEIDFPADANVIFGDPTVVGFPTINVSDFFNGGGAQALGSANGNQTFTNSRPFECPTDPNAYNELDFYSASFPNIAKINETGQQDDANVDVECARKTETTSELSAVGDRVWFDGNKDGIQDPDEAENIKGITVTLYSDNYATALQTDVTDVNGVYGFTNLNPGRYCLEFELPAKFVASPGDVGGNDNIDSDNETAIVDGETTHMRTGCFDLAPGQDDLSWDLGIVAFPVPTNENVEPQPGSPRSLFLPTMGASSATSAAQQ